MNKKIKIKDIYPLSPMQEGLLFQTLYEIKSDLYFVQRILTLEGDVDPKIMKSSWEKIMNSHDILRTGFVWQDGEEPEQYILESTSIPIPFEFHDWVQEGNINVEVKLEEFIRNDRQQVFDLSKAPLFRITLIKYNVKKYCFIWSQHHIITDGWSSSIVLEELLNCYQQIINKQNVELPNRRPFSEYILWLKNNSIKKEAEYFWKQYLKDIGNTSEVLFKVNSDKHKEHKLTLTISETTEIKKLSIKNHLTMNTIVLGAISLILSIYNQKPDIIIGMAFSGRSIDLEGIEEMVGIFINTLPIRIKAYPQNSIKYFLKSLQQDIQLLHDYICTPLSQIQLWTECSQPIFNSVFTFENYHIDNSKYVEKLGFTITDIKNIEKNQYPLSITATCSAQLQLNFSYKMNSCSETMIGKLIESIFNLFKIMTQEIEKPIGSISFITESDKSRILEEWNRTSKMDIRYQPIYQLIETEAARTPDKIALVYEDRYLSYEVLNARANQLAHYLRKRGVGAESVVVILMERSLEMIIGLLAVLKAGGAYVPIDPNYPEERITYILEDTQSPFILTMNTVEEKIPSTHSQVIVVSEHNLELDKESNQNLMSISCEKNLAYIIYTSGSTGKPKGVMINHRSLNSYLESARDCYAHFKGSSLLHSSYAFDMSITSIFLPLILGNRLHIFSEKEEIDRLMLVLEKESDIGFIKVTPTHLRALKNIMKPDEARRNKRLNLIIGGENLLREDVGGWLDLYSNDCLINEYGPTEATVGCCIYEIEQKSLANLNSIPIGRPMENSKLYLLDKNMELAPIGAMGEIYIGGLGLARGYMNRASLTAECFLPNPFVREDEVSEHPESLRLYKTGDLGRYLPDGDIEFLGRADFQVKIRGYRIELGEIEAVLQQHREISNCVVVVRERGKDDKSLVAYIVLKHQDLPDITETLKDYLLEKLPEYMVPSYFVYIDKLPLTLSGKIDRKSLPEPDISNQLLREEYIAPRTKIESELSEIWLLVLKIERVGVYDDFFKLGGHSLLAMQVISRIRNQYEVDIPLKALFENPTIDSLGKRIEELRKEQKRTAVPKITQVERDGEMPLSFAQQRLWFLDQLLPGAALYNVPIVLKIEGLLEKDCLMKAINKIIERHEILRTIFPNNAGEPYQNILPELKLELCDVLVDLQDLNKETQQEKIREIGRQEANWVFDLNKGPLIRVKLLVSSEVEHLLLITVHHIIFDGWSIKILFTELNHCYMAYLNGENDDLRDLPLQYLDFAMWQRKWLQGLELERQLGYWKEELRGIPDLSEFMTDKSRPKELSYRGGHYECSLSKEIREGILKVAREEQASMFMVLLAAFQVLLYKCSGQEDIVVGSPIANRNHQEVEGLIGFFVNTLALRIQFTGQETFREVIRKVREAALRAYDHQDVPFEQLVDYLDVPRLLNRNPVFQIMFHFDEEEVTEHHLNLGKLKVKFCSNDYYEVAKVDLIVNVYNKNKLRLHFEYSKDLYQAKSIERLAVYFDKILGVFTKNKEININSVSVLNEEEQFQLLKELYGTK